MNNNEISYQFTGKLYQYSTSDMGGWNVVFLPKEISIEIRNNYKNLEEGWGRLKITAQVGKTEWKTSLWYDTKHDTYMLPIKAIIRKKENIILNKQINIVIYV